MLRSTSRTGKGSSSLGRLPLLHCRRVRAIAVIIAAVVMLTTLALHSLPKREVAEREVVESASPDRVLSAPVPVPSATGAKRKLFEVRTEPKDPAVHYLDVFDPMPPREGESFVTFEQYLDCLAARVNVDRRRQVELPFDAAERTKQWPYVMVPATAEIRDIKGLMCNISIHIRHLTYVQNFDVPAMSAFFDDVQRAFNFTKRVKILRYRDNAGFAGAVNIGYRDALRYPFHEVPFFFLSNNDMRFGPGLLETMMPRYYEAVADDEAMIKQLEAEVATEPNEHTPSKMRHPLLRSDGLDTYLVTSRLLPDRIRYASRIDQRRSFSKFYGGLFLERGGGTSTWGQSRLVMETVGLWDENFYPAYIEDTDYRFRMMALGFKDCLPPFGLGGFVHFTSVSIKTGEGDRPGHIMKAVSEVDASAESTKLPRELLNMYIASQKGFYRGLLHVLRQHVGEEYNQYKWGIGVKDNARGPYLDWRGNEGEHTVKLLPLDCWVWGVERREAIAVSALVTVQHFISHPNASLDEPFLYFLPEETVTTLTSKMEVDRTLALRSSYVDGDALKRLPSAA